MERICVATVTSLGDRVPYLLELYGSLLDQTHEGWDWFIHTNNVTQAQVEEFWVLLHEVQTKHAASRVKNSNEFDQQHLIRILRSRERRLVFEARNEAATDAVETGTYGYFLNVDDDDLLPEDSLTRHVSALKAHPEAGWSIGSQFDVDASGVPYNHFVPDLPMGLIDIHDLERGWQDPEHCLPAFSHIIMFRMSLFLAIGGYPSIDGDDIAIAFKAADAAMGVNHAEIVYHYRDHAEQTMKTATYLKEEAAIRNGLHALMLSYF